MGRFVRLLFSGAVAGVATLGFVGAVGVGANLNGLVLVLFAGFWLGLHAFFGFVRLSRRMDHAMRLTLMSSAEYDRLNHGADAVVEGHNHSSNMSMAGRRWQGDF